MHIKSIVNGWFRGLLRVRGVFLSAAAIVAGNGCVTPSPKAMPDGAAAHSKVADSGQGETTDGDEKTEALTAVEDFLLRTQQYRLSPPTTGRTAADPVLFSAAPSKSPSGQTSGLPDTAGVDAGRPSLTSADNGSLNEAVPAVSANIQMDVGTGALPTVALPALERISVRTDESTTATTKPEANITNAPMHAPSPNHRDALEQLISRLRDDVTANNDFESHWRLRLVQLAADFHDDAITVSPDLPEDSRAMLSALVEAAIVVRRLARNPMLDPRDFLDRLEALRLAMAEKADPRIVGVALCSKVSTFGMYEEMAHESFVAGRSIPTILYSELSDLRAEKVEDGLFETRLASRVELFTADGRSVWARDEPQIVDRCRHRRRDFFLAQRLTIPATLPAGDYVLKLFVEDQIAGKAAETAKGLSILSPVSVARLGGS